jgi:hypothetical protein
MTDSDRLRFVSVCDRRPCCASSAFLKDSPCSPLLAPRVTDRLRQSAVHLSRGRKDLTNKINVEQLQNIDGMQYCY